MKRDFIAGLLLITFSIFSIWIFYLLGETDMTGPIFIIMLGVCQVYAAVQHKTETPKKQINKKIPPKGRKT